MTMSKSAKRGRKKKIGPRTPSGQLSRAKQEDATKVAAYARTRILGPDWLASHAVKPLDPMLGCVVGVAIINASPMPAKPTQEDAAGVMQRRASLYAAAQHIRRCYAAYAAANGLPKRSAQVVRILTPVDAMQASADDPAPDLRTEGERAASADAAWWNICCQMDALTKAVRSDLKAMVLDDLAISNERPVIAALEGIAAWLEGRKKRGA